MLILEIIFWLSIFMIFYAYFGYPAILAFLSLFRNRAVRMADIYPQVTFIITAFNEEKRIGEKIENTLALDYPKDKIEILIASDASNDRTDEIVRGYQDRGVKLIRAPERGGKEATQKKAVEASKGEILVFSDVATILDPDGVINIVRSFNDPTVGCVSSVDRFINKEGKVSGEGAYVKYEMLLRSLESRVNTLVGLSGSFFAARKSLCSPWATDLQSDFNTLINSVKKGYRGICDENAVGYYQDLAESKQEFSRKVRTVVRGIRVFMRSLPMLNVFQYSLFSWQFFSHKLCRWMVPFWMIFVLISNFLLVRYSLFYLSLFILQLTFYTLSFAGTAAHFKRQTLKIPSFFVTVNLSILLAWYKYFRGEHFVKWEPSTR